VALVSLPKDRFPVEFAVNSYVSMGCATVLNTP